MIYKYGDMLLKKTRECYCYTMGGNIQKPAALLIKASDLTKGVTLRDFYKALRGPAGHPFFECNHSFLEDVSWEKPGVYDSWWGS